MNEFLAHYLTIMSDPAHLAVEFTFVLLDYLLIHTAIWLWTRRRDRKHGHKENHGR